MKEIVMNKEQIKKVIPHRAPMLMIDEIIEIVPEKSITASLYLHPAFDYFTGHFPNAPVMPGVLTVESMAQAADVLLLSCERYAGTIPYFIGIDDVKFKKKIEPGDTITIVEEIYKENLEKAILTCDCFFYNKDEVATIGKVTLAMR